MSTKMDREGFRGQILGLDVYDTHTHLVGRSLAGRDFWEIGEYFWLLEELQAAGYPRSLGELSEDRRIDAYVKAFGETRNTSMNWVTRRIFEDLYGIDITDGASVRTADEAVREASARPDWPARVAKKIGLKRIVVNVEGDADFRNLPDVSVLVPRIEGPIEEWLSAIMEAKDQRVEAERVSDRIYDTLAGYRRLGCPGIMFALERMALKTHGASESLKASGNSRDEALTFVLSRIAGAAETNGLFIQLFLGVEGGWNSMGFAMGNDPDRVVKLHGLFESHACDFELVLGSEMSHLDAVQAARAYPNVYVGGQWWFNFRVSTYLDSMQKRLEALPPSKCSLVVSDGRCIEWCYGKILLVKRLLADFLFDRIQQGWLDREEALRVAREWLYGSAAGRYKSVLSAEG
ncbi:MAG: glucuronate isomerase [Armatimonadota bacterium]|nr:glucuronate isomerase [Armatimonadota bacterium]